MKRRSFLASASLPLLGCDQPAGIVGGFTGTSPERGHRLRPSASSAQANDRPTPTITRRAHVVIAGGGVAGLAAARALRQRGMDDFALLELEDSAGGNSRGGVVGGIACPLGAHYLPVPGDGARAVQDLLEELGLRQRVAGRWVYDERHLCHSPQERLFFNGGGDSTEWQWQEGLLPVQGVGPDTLAQYRRFALLVAQAEKAGFFPLPISNRPPALSHVELDAMTFIAWLDRHGLTDPHLRWYLGYCCRDDYGAGIASVSAWAGIHYFASRHGFHAPGDGIAGSDGVLTWPEGNGWLTRQLATPLGDRLHTGRVVTRIAVEKHGVSIDTFDAVRQHTERWQAQHCIVALPLFVAARVLVSPPAALLQATTQLRYAPWLVANIHIRAALQDRPGAAPSWDNVVYGARGLGYVDAMHQSLRPVAGATVLTCYHPLGDQPEGRRTLLQSPWTRWRNQVLADLAVPHPDLKTKATRIDVTRYGHAMSVPVPGLRGSAALAALQQPLSTAGRRLQFAHSDLSGYSVFEEAFTHGHRAGMAAS